MMPTNQILRIHEACRLVRCHRSRNAPMTLLTIVTSNASNNQPMPRAAVRAVCTRFHWTASSLRNSAVIVVDVPYDRNPPPVLLPSSRQSRDSKFLKHPDSVSVKDQIVDVFRCEPVSWHELPSGGDQRIAQSVNLAIHLDRIRNSAAHLLA